jgi:glucosamine 6-phosphate synthetase-like amidotransferase/phosphosugar isomerase protein
MASFVVALLGISSLATWLTAGSLVARIGEQRTLMGAGALDAVAVTVAFLSSSVAVLTVAVIP